MCVVPAMRRACSVVLALFLLAACEGTSHRSMTNRTVATKVYRDDSVAFSYPAIWNQKSFTVVSSFSRVLTYVSTQRLHDPCITKRTSNGTMESCASPVSSLPPHAAVATWSDVGFPGRGLAQEPGAEHRFPHAHGRLAITRPGTAGCTEQIHASFVLQRLPSHDQLLTMDACITGPNTSSLQADVLRMLASTKVATH